MSERVVDGPDRTHTKLWLHLPNLKKLAKIVKEVAVVLHGRALDGLCRAAGYEHYTDALHRPRALSVSVDEWRRRLAQEFELDDGELLEPSELLAWYPRVFVERGWHAAELRLGARARQLGASIQDDAGDCEAMPPTIDHQQTLVDGIWQKTSTKS